MDLDKACTYATHVRLKAVSPDRPGVMKARAALEEDRATLREIGYSELKVGNERVVLIAFEGVHV